jgi:hypothetical protein
MKLRHLVLATLAGMALRLFFIAKFPYSAGDTEVYEELARNLLDTGSYGVYFNNSFISCNMRMPGYPFFLAVVEWLLGPGEVRIMVVQAAVDVLACLGIAWLAAKLNPRAGVIALWMAILCPFTANYTATPLTETLAIAMTTVCLLVLCDGASDPALDAGSLIGLRARWFLGGVVTGLATLVRPESPLVLAAAGLALAWTCRREFFHGAVLLTFLRLTRTAVLMAAGLMVVLLPWGFRTWTATGKFEIVSNPNATMPWEPSSPGFGAWGRTWLVTSQETYDVGFKFEDEEINPQDLPPSAFDSEAERQEIFRLIEGYNLLKRIPPNLDWEFAKLARERAARHPIRQYVGIPLLRAIHYWLTPRIQLLPYSGKVSPWREAFAEDPVDFSVTVGFFVLNLAYLSLGILGAWRCQRSYPAACLTLFLLIRTLFLTEHGSIEPRYMLVCYPALIALGAAALSSTGINDAAGSPQEFPGNPQRGSPTPSIAQPPAPV